MKKSFQQKISTLLIQLMRLMEHIILMINIGLMVMFCITTILVISVISKKNRRSESGNILIISRICIYRGISIRRPSLEVSHFGKIYSGLGPMGPSIRSLSFLTKNNLKNVPESPLQKLKYSLLLLVKKLAEESTSI